MQRYGAPKCPGKRGAGWEELESKEKVVFSHLPMPERLKCKNAAIKCHCRVGTLAGSTYVTLIWRMSSESFRRQDNPGVILQIMQLWVPVLTLPLPGRVT